MKWKHKVPTKEREPAIGETREVQRFLWLPLRLGNETRWLENATIIQMGCECYDGFYGLLRGTKFFDESFKS